MAQLADGELGALRSTDTGPEVWVTTNADGAAMPYASWRRADAGHVVGWVLHCAETDDLEGALPLDSDVTRTVEITRLRRAPSIVADDLAHGWVHVDDADIDLSRRPDVTAYLDEAWRDHVDHVDSITRVEDAARALGVAATGLDDAVARARTRGHSWTDIGNAVGIRRQSARARWKHLDPTT